MTPQIGSREVVYENLYQKIYRVSAQFDGFKKEFFVNSLGQRVGLLIVKKNGSGDGSSPHDESKTIRGVEPSPSGVTENEHILLVRQYRLLINKLAWEIPGGKIDSGETPEQGAAREGLEETCLRCRSVKPLLYFHPGLDTFDNPTFLYYCDDFEEASPENFHAQEVSERVWVPLQQCIEMIFRREIVDSLTIVALLAYHTKRATAECRMEKEKMENTE